MGKAYPTRVLDALQDGMTLYTPSKKRIPIRGPEDVFKHLKDPVAKLDREIFLCVLMDARHAIIRVFAVSLGSLNASIVHPREVFKPAIRFSAAGVILVHNHPSGQHDPSDDDLALTRRLAQVGELIGIPVLDHIVIATSGFTSLKQLGHL